MLQKKNIYKGRVFMPVIGFQDVEIRQEDFWKLDKDTLLNLSKELFLAVGMGTDSLPLYIKEFNEELFNELIECNIIQFII